jgi:hypothetical protein
VQAGSLRSPSNFLPRLISRDRQQLVEDRTHGRRFADEMGCKRVMAARMRLIAISELPRAVRTAPELRETLERSIHL